ncbi:MAG TPA: hypothetical protein VLB84_09400 [Bacteroidia bacterium]|nr:hypothetical protein [Bacteroidia bacterium]
MKKSNHNTATEAVIYLKNGKRKYGVLIENDEIYNSYQFISNEKIATSAPGFDDCIELLSAELIEAIDINLK